MTTALLQIKTTPEI